MNGRMLPVVVMLGWSVAAGAQPGQDTKLTGERFEMACAPMSPPALPTPAIRVLGSYERGRILFGPGEQVLVNAGGNQGIRTGQEYYVRRVVQDRFTQWTLGYPPVSIHTAGWVRIDDVQGDMAVATVTHACDGVIYGDYLEPFVDPVLPPPPAAATGPADVEHQGRIVLGDDKRQTGAAGSLMVLNQGADQGVRAGEAVTIYRPTPEWRRYDMGYKTRPSGGPSLRVGTARVVSVQPQTALVRIESSREAIYVGDFAAVHRIPQ